MRLLYSHIYNALRWSERYVKTDMVYLARGGFWLGTGQMLTVLVSFGSTVAFGYFLPKTSYGDYRYVLSLFAILSAFTLTGMQTALTQSVAMGFDGSLRQAVRLTARWSLLAVAISLCGSGYYAFQGNTFLAASLILVAFAIPVLYCLGHFASFLNGKKDYARLSLYSFFDNTIPLLITTGSLLLTQNVLVLLTVYFVTSALMGLALYLRTLAVYRPARTEDPDLERYSVRLSMLNVVSIITQHLDKVIVYTFLGSIELAVYGFAAAFPDQIRFLLKNLNTLMVPKFTERTHQGHGIDIRRKTLQLLIVLVVITGAYMAVSHYLYMVFFPKYPESAGFSNILALMILSSLALIPNSLFIARKQEKRLAQATIGSSLAQLAILVPAAHYGGLLGVCLTRVASSYILTGIAFFLIRDELGQSGPKTPPAKTLG